MIENTASFGRWIRRRRRMLDMTQAELADRVACAVITIRKIESDERRPSRLMAERLADALAIDPASRDRFIGAARALLSPTRLQWPVPDASFGESAVPVPLTSFVGRERELDDLTELCHFSGGESRLITVTGPPGVGKTRLAQELAVRAERKFDVPAVYVELASATTADELPGRIAAAVAIPSGLGADRFSLAVGALLRGPTLLVLDNFEHLLDAGPSVTDLLRRCPQLTCLATSQARLDLYGEQEYPLMPLAVAPEGVALTATGLDEWPALDLFVQRAGRAAIDSPSDLAHVSEICRVLDGLPLAIELAAGRVRHERVDEIADRLATDVGSLRTTTRDREPRQRSVMAAVEWSHGLLSEAARRALRAAAVFEGWFDRAALGPVAQLDPREARDAHDELVDRSLLRSDPPGRRSSLLAVVRAFALEQLESTGEADAARGRHAQHFTTYAENVFSRVEAWSNTRYLEEIELEIENITAAIRWAFGPAGNPALGRRMTLAIGAYLTQRNRFRDGEAWSTTALETADGASERIGLAFLLAECAFTSGDLAKVEDLLGEAAGWARDAGDTRWLPLILHDQGMLAIVRGDLAVASDRFDEAEKLATLAGTSEALALSHMRMGRVALLQGRLDEARERVDAALDLARTAEDAWGEATALSMAGEIGLAAGEHGAALVAHADAARVYRDAGLDWWMVCNIECMANVLVALGDIHAGALTYGLADQWLDDLGMLAHPFFAPARAKYEGIARAALGEEFDLLMAEGRLLPQSLDAVQDVVGGSRSC